MNKAKTVFEKLSASNAWVEKLVSNGIYKYLAKATQAEELAKSTRALVEVPLDLWPKSGLVSKLQKGAQTTIDISKQQDKVIRTLSTIEKHQPTFFSDKTRHLSDVLDEAQNKLKNISKLNEETLARVKERGGKFTDLLNFALNKN